MPTARADVVRLAWPVVGFTVPVPIFLPLAWKVTRSLDVRMPLTVAVKVTDWPKTEGAAEAVRTVLLGFTVTVCVSVVLPAVKFPVSQA